MAVLTIWQQQPIVSGGHRQQYAVPILKPSRTVPGAHSVQLASKPPSAPALHWHLVRDRILGILRPLCNPKRTLSFWAAHLRSAPCICCRCRTTDLCLCDLRWCRQHRILKLFQDDGASLLYAGCLWGLDARFSSIAWTSDTSLVLHFQGSLCTVVAVHSLRSLESAELYVFITQRLPRISRWIPSTRTWERLNYRAPSTSAAASLTPPPSTT